MKKRARRDTKALDVPLYIHPAIPPKTVVETYYKMDDPYHHQ